MVRIKKFLLCLNTEVPLFPRIFSASHIHEQGRTDALAVSCSSNNSWFNHEVCKAALLRNFKIQFAEETEFNTDANQPKRFSFPQG